MASLQPQPLSLLDGFSPGLGPASSSPLSLLFLLLFSNRGAPETSSSAWLWPPSASVVTQICISCPHTSPGLQPCEGSSFQDLSTWKCRCLTRHDVNTPGVTPHSPLAPQCAASQCPHRAFSHPSYKPWLSLTTCLTPLLSNAHGFPNQCYPEISLKPVLSSLPLQFPQVSTPIAFNCLSPLPSSLRLLCSMSLPAPPTLIIPLSLFFFFF